LIYSGAPATAILIAKELNSSTAGSGTSSSVSVSNLPSTIFTTDRDGTADVALRVNFQRDITNVSNPFKVHFSDLNVSDKNTSLHIGTNTSPNSIDVNGTMIYGRTHASRQRYQNNVGTANIYYESYCYGTDSSGVSCDKTLLPDGDSSTRTDDIRWFINFQHVVANDGNIGTVIEKGATHIPSVSGDIIYVPSQTNANPSVATLNYKDSVYGYPYKTTMENNASGWLIYNRDNPTATRNQFSVEFNKAGTGWSGAHEANNTTSDPINVHTNRRSMW
jgi:hypothetical protein